MSLPEIDEARLQRITTECEKQFEPDSFDELCEVVTETNWATKQNLTAKLVSELIHHHNIKTKYSAATGEGSPPTPSPVVASTVGGGTVVLPPTTAPPAVPASNKDTPKAGVSDVGGKGRKQCPNCQKYVGNRNAVCPNCDHEFQAKTAPAPKAEKPAEPAPKPVVKPVEVKPAAVAPKPAPKPVVEEEVETPHRFKVGERPSTLNITRTFVHASGDLVWENQNGMVWYVDKKTLEPLNDKRYYPLAKVTAGKLKDLFGEFHTWVNVETGVCAYEDEGATKLEDLPEHWRNMLGLHQQLVRETQEKKAAEAILKSDEAHLVKE